MVAARRTWRSPPRHRRPAPSTGDLLVTVTDRATVPLSGAQVTLAGGTGATAHTDGRGRILFAGLPPGAYTAAAVHPRFFPGGSPATVAAGKASAITLAL